MSEFSTLLDNADDVAHADEGMDLLWEEYETESNKAQLKSNSKLDYDEESVVQLCCLQALKLSAGKMNLGMGKSNIVTISKALKRFGWFSNRRGKKRYPLK